MKICPKCGAQQSDSRTFCIDCGKKLGKKLSKDKERHIHQLSSNKVTRMTNSYQPYTIKKSDKIVGYAAIVLAVATFILMIIFKRNSNFLSFSIICLILLIETSLNSLKPNFLWNIHKFDLSLSMKGVNELEPNKYSHTTRDVITYFFFVIAIFIMICLLISL